jgi:hypothetical protein
MLTQSLALRPTAGGASRFAQTGKAQPGSVATLSCGQPERPAQAVDRHDVAQPLQMFRESAPMFPSNVDEIRSNATPVAKDLTKILFQSTAA